MAAAALRFWNDRFIWTSPAHRGGHTSRPSIAILIGAWGALRVGHDGGEVRARVVAVNSATPRTIDAREGFYSFNLDPIHPLCRQLRSVYFAQCGVIDLDLRLGPPLLDRVAAEVRQPARCDEAHALSEDLLAALFPEARNCPPIDERVLAAALWLREHLPSRSYLDELTRLCGLSPDRLSHLFKREMGVPIKSYLLAMKMRQAALWFGQNRSLTEIAHMMGFSDSPHLSKAFQAYFSVPPSLLANTELVAVSHCA